jgi:DNA-binding MurR/RpiR family transcriptional regulator
VTVAIKEGKIASLMGLEGCVFDPAWGGTEDVVHTCSGTLLAVGLRNSGSPRLTAAVLRMYHQLGVRYMTLTHSCNNAFADSAGIFEQVEEKWGGLSFVYLLI